MIFISWKKKVLIEKKIESLIYNKKIRIEETSYQKNKFFLGFKLILKHSLNHWDLIKILLKSINLVANIFYSIMQQYNFYIWKKKIKLIQQIVLFILLVEK